MMMMMRVHDNDRDHDNQHRQFPSSQRGEADGPTTTTTPRLPPRTNDIYDIVGSRIDHVFVSGGCSAPLQQPFHTPASTSTSIYSTAFNKSSGESMGFPFTNAQWRELERQAMIYKYMVASIPVPLDLLLPITNRNLCASSSPLVNGGELKLRFSNGADPEPGRCKRTDGKKWRCSRDVAPDQKYCERHMHRGRPCSRKHVELHVNNNNNNNATSNKRTRLDHHHHNHQNSNNGSATTLSSSNFLGGSALLPYHPSPVFESLPSHLSSDKEPRSLEWMMKGGEHVPMATSSDPTWLHLMNHTKLEMTSKPSSMEEPFLNLNSYANFTTGEEHENDRDCALFLNPDNVVSDPPRSFIDAWSSQTQESNHQVKKLSPSSSSLTLSMGNNNNDKSPSCSWLSPPLTSSWVGSPLGGPLGEVLRPSTASDPPSPFTGNGDSGSPPATVASSPSGVLQKTLNATSLSDSSGCSSSSLALGSSNAKPEISLL